MMDEIIIGESLRWIAIVPILIYVCIFALSIYALILTIKTLKIYIKKNS